MKCHIGEATEAVDLNGRLMLPGFQDCHTHAYLAGLYKLPWFLDVGADKVSCLADLRKILAEAAAEMPKGQWIWDPASARAVLRNVPMHSGRSRGGISMRRCRSIPYGWLTAVCTIYLLTRRRWNCRNHKRHTGFRAT